MAKKEQNPFKLVADGGIVDVDHEGETDSEYQVRSHRDDITNGNKTQLKRPLRVD